MSFKEVARSHHKINILIAGKDYPATDEVKSSRDPILYIVVGCLNFNGTSLYIFIKSTYYYTSDVKVSVFVKEIFVPLIVGSHVPIPLHDSVALGLSRDILEGVNCVGD